jgi:hypothetical protein
MKIFGETVGRYILLFENMEEFQADCAPQISSGEIPIPADPRAPIPGIVNLTSRIVSGCEFPLMVKVFQRDDGTRAAAFQKKPEEFLSVFRPPNNPDAEEHEESPAIKSDWDRVRNLTRTAKLLLAPKGTRLERAILAQDNDSILLYTLLKNPRITKEEVVRIARSPGLSPNVVDLILSCTQWSMSNEIRIALVQNPRTPIPVALKLLPTLSEPVIRQIAKATAVNQTLKQAAVRLVAGTGKN